MFTDVLNFVPEIIYATLAHRSLIPKLNNMKKLILVAVVFIFSTVAFSQSVVTEPVGVKKVIKKPQTYVAPQNSSHTKSMPTTTVVKTSGERRETRPKRTPVVIKRSPVKH